MALLDLEAANEVRRGLTGDGQQGFELDPPKIDRIRLWNNSYRFYANLMDGESLTSVRDDIQKEHQAEGIGINQMQQTFQRLSGITKIDKNMDGLKIRTGFLIIALFLQSPQTDNLVIIMFLLVLI